MFIAENLRDSNFESRAPIQYKDVVLPVMEIPLWR